MAKDVKKKTAKVKSKPVAARKPAAKASPRKALPLPDSIPDSIPDGAKPRKAALKAEARHLEPLHVAASGDVAVLRRLWDTVETRRQSGDAAQSHSARLLARGTPKVAQKLGEEAVECVIEAIQGNRTATILESADLLYHLIVLWVDAGIAPEEVWAELERREGISGIVEKASRPKGIVRAAETTKLP